MYDDAVLFLDDPAVQADTTAQTLDADHGRSRPAAPAWSPTWPGWRNATAFPACRRSRGHRQPRGRDRPDHHTPSPVRPVTSVTADALLATVRSRASKPGTSTSAHSALTTQSKQKNATPCVAVLTGNPPLCFKPVEYRHRGLLAQDVCLWRSGAPRAYTSAFRGMVEPEMAGKIEVFALLGAAAGRA